MPRRSSRIALCVLALMGIVTNCTALTQTSEVEPVSVEGPDCPDGFEETIGVSEGVEIDVSNSLTLTLGSTPSVPCTWHAPEIDDPALIRQVDHQSKWPAEGATPQPGAPGTEIWAFEALAAGRTQISLNCYCLDEEGADEELRGTFVLNVAVE